MGGSGESWWVGPGDEDYAYPDDDDWDWLAYGPPDELADKWFQHHVVSLGYPYTRPKPEMNGQGKLY